MSATKPVHYMSLDGENINSIDDVLLADKDRVYGSVDAGGSITAMHATAKSLNSKAYIFLTNSTISSGVTASGSIHAKECPQLRSVKAGGSVTLEGCEAWPHVFAGSSVWLSKSTILGNVFAGTDATVLNSTIRGNLVCTSANLSIDHSFIDRVDLRYPTGITAGPSQRLRLNNSSVRHIVFEGGNGEVILSGSSKIDIITGGRLKV